nr:4a-hydroxytetrahydrobiopterin dehydratase [Synechococcus elongatus PCC 11802]
MVIQNLSISVFSWTSYCKVLAITLIAGTLPPVVASPPASVARSSMARNVEMNSVLSAAEIQTRLLRLPAWRLDGQAIVCDRRFAGFPEAIAFLDRLVEPAEVAGHHPDLEVSYNRVTIRLTTHDAGGLTEKDFALAETISQL